MQGGHLCRTVTAWFCSHTLQAAAGVQIGADYPAPMKSSWKGEGGRPGSSRLAVMQCYSGGQQAGQPAVLGHWSRCWQWWLLLGPAPLARNLASSPLLVQAMAAAAAAADAPAVAAATGRAAVAAAAAAGRAAAVVAAGRAGVAGAAQVAGAAGAPSPAARLSCTASFLRYLTCSCDLIDSKRPLFALLLHSTKSSQFSRGNCVIQPTAL